MKTKRSPEEIAAWREKMSATAKRVRAMSKEERDALAIRCGTCNPEGRSFSIFNTCFLWAQAGKTILMAGGFRQWQRAGRMVKKGEHAAGLIYIPINPAKQDAEPDGEKEDVHFRLVPVFDVEQTQLMEVTAAM